MINTIQPLIGRIVSEHKKRYVIKTETGEFEAEIPGRMRYQATSREDFPATGDWVSFTPCDSGPSMIQSILPRFSVVSRPAVGKFGESQIIATNIDYALIVQAVDRDFNINRLERCLSICHASHVQPIIVLSKTDLLDRQSVDDRVDRIRQRIQGIRIVPISNETHEGYQVLLDLIEKGKTYCLMGSSGVGKSTLINRLTGTSAMKTGELSHSTSKGRHVTSHRELFVLENGGILIDNPGMREIGVASTSHGIGTTFGEISDYSGHCKFRDCTHTQEVGCAVLEALENGEIDRNHYDNYIKMEKERSHFETTVVERRKKDKAFGKMIKNYLKNRQ